MPARRARSVRPRGSGFRAPAAPVRVETELVGQHVPRTAVDRQGFRLAATLVQRRHQQAVQPFPQRMLAHELGQLTGDLAMSPAPKLRGVEVLSRRQPAPGEPLDLAGQVRDVDALVRRATPQCQRLTDQFHTSLGIVSDSARFVEERVEPAGVEIIGPHVQTVAIRAEGQPFGIVEQRTQPISG